MRARTWQGSPPSKRCLLSQRELSKLDQHACSPGGQKTHLWLAIGWLCCGDLLASSVVDHQFLISAPWAQEQPAYTRLACVCRCFHGVLPKEVCSPCRHGCPWGCLLAAVQMGGDGGRVGVGSLLPAFCYRGTSLYPGGTSWMRLLMS